MISLKHGFLFIHIPKTAGNSIQNVLKDYSEEKVVSIAPYQDGIERFEIRSDSYEIRKHSTLLEYQEQLGKDVIDVLFKFTCVRNPWERMISLYFSPHRGAVKWDRQEFVGLVQNTKQIADFVAPVRDEQQGQQIFENVDFYIRFEQLNHDFEKLCNRIGIPAIRLPQRNVSEHKHYSSYYDDELIELVEQLFCKEISFFEFKFERAN